MITRGLGTALITRGYGGGLVERILAEVVRLTSRIAIAVGLRSRL